MIWVRRARSRVGKTKIMPTKHVVSYWQVTESGAMKLPVLLAAMLALPVQLLPN